MKRRMEHESFLEQLRAKIRTLKRMKPGDVHVFSINASYGHYQILIGPEPGDRKRMRDGHRRSIEINGEIHHLFVSPHEVRIHPSENQVTHNMRDTVIMRDLSIHILDPHGDGKHLAHSPSTGIHAREVINLAGDEGQKIVEESEHDSQLMMEAYRIVQQDILKALQERREETTESAD